MACSPSPTRSPRVRGPLHVRMPNVGELPDKPVTAAGLVAILTLARTSQHQGGATPARSAERPRGGEWHFYALSVW